jgi:hypothetical protein
MKIAKLMACCVAGLTVSALIYFLAVITVIPFSQKLFEAPSLEDALPFAFQLVGTICLFIGSTLSGWLLALANREVPLWHKWLASPGLYAGALLLYQSRGTVPYFVQFAVVTSPIWLALSVAGVIFGCNLYNKKLTNDCQST